MLTGRAEEVIQQRKEHHIVAQQRRKEVNKWMAGDRALNSEFTSQEEMSKRTSNTKGTFNGFD